MAKIFPNDLERKEAVKSNDVLLMADSEDANIAKNVTLENVLGYVATAAGIEKIVNTNESQQATIASQQAVIASQQATITELTDTNDTLVRQFDEFNADTASRINAIIGE